MTAAEMLAKWDALEAAGCCECGVALDVHPDLPPPKPWGRKVSIHANLTRRSYHIKAKWAQAANVRS